VKCHTDEEAPTYAAINLGLELGERGKKNENPRKKKADAEIMTEVGVKKKGTLNDIAAPHLLDKNSRNLSSLSVLRKPKMKKKKRRAKRERRK